MHHVASRGKSSRLSIFLAYSVAGLLLASTMVAGQQQPAQAAACGSGSAPTGSGTSGSPYQIATKENLYWISATSASWSNKYFTQTADIDLGGCDFTPIASGSSITGEYDGNGFTISGLSIDSTDSEVGLFANSFGPFSIKNLGLVNASVITRNTGTSNSVGAVLGEANNFSGNITVSEVFVSGVVRATTASNHAGGIIGEARERSQGYSITLSNSNSSASVRTLSGGAGGLIGNSNMAADNSSVIITDSFAIGLITVDSDSTRERGLVGNSAQPNRLVVTNTFWDSDTTGASSGSPLTPDIGSPKTTAELNSLSTFSTWDIVDGWEEFNFDSPSNYWGICADVNDGYPFLLWQYTSDPCPAGDSSSSSSAEASAGVPGIFLYVAGPVGRTVGHSPVYYGADRVAATSEYEVRILSISTRNPMVASLASGELPINGSLPSTMVRLPQLEPGTYLVRMTGKHTTGRTLELTAQITVGPKGTFTAIGPNIPIIR